MTAFGKYEIMEEIGRGGFGVVYKARDTSLDRIVALKVFKSNLIGDPGFIERFKREAQSAANLKHSNIVTIYECGEFEGMYSIAMEYLEGKSLACVITEAGTIPLERICGIISQIADALDYAHQHELIHRDVKPSNIIIGDNDRATLTDFGLVKSESGSGMPSSEQLVGTAEYMAPEQAEGKPVDARTDIYALGIVLYEMLTGKVPFKAETTLATMYKQVHEQPPSIRELPLPPGIDQVVQIVLSKKPDDRYPTAMQFAKALTQAAKANSKSDNLELGWVLGPLLFIAVTILEWWQNSSSAQAREAKESLASPVEPKSQMSEPPKVVPPAQPTHSWGCSNCLTVMGICIMICGVVVGYYVAFRANVFSITLVDATAGSVDSGLIVRANNQVRIIGMGFWSADKINLRYVDRNGYTTESDIQIAGGRECRIVDVVPLGKLLVRIGDAYYLADQFTAQTDGRVWFAINDRCANDNSGAVLVLLLVW